MFYRIDNALSERHFDENGYLYVDRSPILKAGIMEYLGYELLPEGKSSIDGVDIDPQKVYKVNVSLDELKKAKDTFKLAPITDGHIWLGEEGADPKNYQEGTVGENLYIEDGFLYAPLNFTGKAIVEKIKNHKKEELSTSYLNKLRKSDNPAYDFEAFDIRGNHLALVDRGRAGSDVRVLNSNLTGVNNMNWNEADHPRDDAGRFTDKGGESGELSYKFEKVKRPDGKEYDYEKASFKYNDAEIDAIKRGDGWISGKIYAPDGKKIKGTGDTWMDFETKEADFDNYIKSVVKDSAFYVNNEIPHESGNPNESGGKRSYNQKGKEAMNGEKAKIVNEAILELDGERIDLNEMLMNNEAGEGVDKRKLIDEVGGMLKDKVDDELWRTIIGKLEKLSYNGSEDSKQDNKCKNEEPKEDDKEEKAKDKADKAEDKAEKAEEKADKDSDESKSMNYDAIYEKVFNSLKAESEKNEAEKLKAYNSVRGVLGDFNPFGMTCKDMYVKALNQMGVALDGKENESELGSMFKACASMRSKVDNGFSYSSNGAEDEIEINL